MGENKETLRVCACGPRWAKFPSYLRDVAWMSGMNIKIEVEKGWIMESVRFEVKGTHSEMEWFARQLDSSIKEYNK